ncbi:hypothetical protein PPERSA_11516 [Pseudocohnilembus persalinus]|uniref:Uncharacterized protein n=1 Tax=Pseudocohnilembus persalinus TaxID=266149 RepID=A0A0V0QX88_PSEPJ|nr:hypothetical protein PPERSA_11516 [Pseudocohnilembus persalinus]|eukprot:KRX06871.1 hypothetical protein PPERSA_11516 [Pseudocohnilembus persalinus]
MTVIHFLKSYLEKGYININIIYKKEIKKLQKQYQQKKECSQDSFEIKKWIDQPDQESQNQAKSYQSQTLQLDNNIEYFINEDELEKVIRYNEGSYQQQIQLRDQLLDLIKSPTSSQQLKGTAQCWLAWYHLLPLADYKEDEKQAVKIFNEYQDSPFGQFCMAMTYLQGYAEQEKNPELTWFYAQKSSTNGDRRGIGLVGYLYHTSFGVENNMLNAIIYYERAADLGNANAMYNLGICYYNGDGVNQNKEKAIEYYKIAAKKQYQGAVEALQELGIDIKQEVELEIEKQVQEEKLIEFQEENKPQNQKLQEKKYVLNNENNLQEK